MLARHPLGVKLENDRVDQIPSNFGNLTNPILQLCFSTARIAVSIKYLCIESGICAFFIVVFPPFFWKIWKKNFGFGANFHIFFGKIQNIQNPKWHLFLERWKSDTLLTPILTPEKFWPWFFCQYGEFSNVRNIPVCFLMKKNC